MLRAAAAKGSRLRAENGVRIAPPGDEPKWNPVFPRGTWYGANLAPLGGKIELTDGMFAEMIANWTAAGKPSLPIWWNHPDDDAVFSAVPAEERKKAAGWIEDLRIGPDGLEALTKWTPAAKARIEADEYRYFSPEWTSEHTDRRTGEAKGWWLYGVALLNDPFFHEMPRVAAAVPTQPPQPGEMPEEQHSMNPEMMKRLRAALGLPETATDEEMVAKCEAMSKAGVEAPEKLQAAVKEGAELVAKPLRESLEAAKTEIATLKASLVKAAADRFDADAKALCEELVAAGKVLPAHTEKVVAFAKRTSLEEAREVYGALPKAGPDTEEKGLDTTTQPPADLAVLKAEYEAELDKAKANGEKIHAATRRLRSDPKFKPYLVASAKSLAATPEKN